MRKEERTQTRTEGGRDMRIERKEAEQLVSEKFNTSSVRLIGKLVARSISKAELRTAKRFLGDQYEQLALQIIEDVLDEVSNAAFEELGRLSNRYDRTIKNFLIEKYQLRLHVSNLLEEGDPSKYLVEMAQMDFAIVTAMTDTYTKVEKEFWTNANLSRLERIYSKNAEERMRLEGMFLAVFDTLHSELAKAIGELEVALSEAQRDIGYFVKEEGR